MFELKYFAKIEAYEREEKATTNPQRQLPFDITVLGAGGMFSAAMRRFTRWLFLFAFWMLRAVWPVARVGRLVIVSRYDDVRAALADREHFLAPFGPEMRALTGGEDFLLGIDGSAHDEQRRILGEVLLKTDVKGIIDNTRTTTELLLKGSGGRIDVMSDLLGRVFTENCDYYFCLDLDDPNAFFERTMAISALNFADPFGNEKTRKLAMNGAVRLRYLVDRAIDRAIDRARSKNARVDKLVDRLVAYRRPDDTKLAKEQIRAMVIGLTIGFIPTSTLGAGKMLEELVRRGLLQSAIGAASAAESPMLSDPVKAANREELKKILFEASRLNPALFPGIFRHVPTAATIAGKPVSAGSVMLVGTMSALRDSRKFKDPGAFEVGRKVDPALMFGEGSHVCLGAHLALEQITEIFQVLFSQPGIRLAGNRPGQLAYVGPFPRRLDFVFQPKTASSEQNLITVQAKVERDRFDEVKALIEGLGNPAVDGTPIAKALKDTKIVHFVSLSAFDAKDPDDKKAKPDPRLVCELNVDGDEDTALAAIAQHAGPLLDPIFDCIAGSKDIDPAKLDCRFKKSKAHFLLERHKTTLHFAPWGPIGLNFNGTPDTPVADIEQQEKVATFAREAVDRYLRVHDGMHKRAVEALAYVRALTAHTRADSYSTAHLSGADKDIEADLMKRGHDLRGFLIRPTRRVLRMSEWAGYDAALGWQGVPAALKSNAGIFLGLLMAASVCLFGGTIHYAVGSGFEISFALAVASAVFGTTLVIATVVRDGFDTLVRWATEWMERFVNLLTILLFCLSAVLFVVVLLVRWFRWPAAFVGFGAASFWALQRWAPEMLPLEQAALAALGGVTITVAIVGIWTWVALPLLRAWRMVVLSLAGASAIFWVFQYGPLRSWELPLFGRLALALLGGLAFAQIVRRFWIWFKPVLRRNRITIEWILGIGALVAVALVLWRYPEQVRFAADQFGSLALAIAGGIVATFLFWLTLFLVVVAILYWHEVRDEIDERIAPIDHTAAIAAKENPPGYAQNHITAVTVMKPGAFRKFTLALSLWAIGKEVQYWFRPGFVLNMGTIHYARWFRLPGSEMMLFLANYDGSWLNYLEDFITKAHEGQSAVWSHGRGFPKTRLLVLGGAKDGDRFKRWVRRQQIVTQFWYSRFPHLTTEQIRTNALIHDGLMRAQTDTAARAWLDCFGTMPRPQDAIETDEVQALSFRGLPSHDYMLCAALTFSDNGAARKDWFTYLGVNVTYGEQPDVDETVATFVAFSARGIAKCLGRNERARAEALATFPAAFRVGMADRAKVLGDTGPSTPDKWQWADIDRVDLLKEECVAAVDAVLFIYGTSRESCKRALDKHRSILCPATVETVMTEPTEKTRGVKEAREKRKAREELLTRMAAERKPTLDDLLQPGESTSTSERDTAMYEHFGFRDGISQPILRGTQREAATDNKADVVEAGEVILGYRDSAGYFAPAVTLAAESDPSNDLETDTPDFLSRFPRFAGSRNTDLRDLGRNGTYVVVRKLMQDVKGFDDFLAVQEKELKKYPGLAESIGGKITKEWIAAKMMGRWRSGASLVSHPHEMTGRRMPDKADNDFSFAADDPQGLRCPFGAHIRRANPRGSLAPNDPKQAEIEKRHRVLRRGRSYGDGDSEKGLLFVALCADLERQFEFLQQSWIGSPYFQGLNNEPDPITSPPPSNGGTSYVFTIPTPAGSVTLNNLRSFVTVTAGGYFFMPSRSAMRFLTRMAGQ
jgi:Dyp-type peroxidase family